MAHESTRMSTNENAARMKTQLSHFFVPIRGRTLRERAKEVRPTDMSETHPTGNPLKRLRVPAFLVLCAGYVLVAASCQKDQPAAQRSAGVQGSRADTSDAAAA